MKRTILLLFSFVSILSALVAAPIERATALQYAKQFLNQTSVSQFTRSSALEVESEPAYIAKDATTGTSHFYVYNLSNDGGFVIVAADTRVRTILGYSFNGGFDKENIPVNMREWLDEYSSQIAYAVKHLPETALPPVVTRGSSMNSVVVGPLLGDIMYDQGAPYNDMCPMDGLRRSVTGCVATAMAQVMRYYQYPPVGKGTKTYEAKKLNRELTVNFSNTTYDWGNMLPTYDSTATDVQKTAVATLMYHAGVAAEMDYSATGSGAYMSDAALGLYQHFDYDIGISLALRQYYSEEEWLQLIKTELNEDRPVIMSGANEEVGHAFVCDGYDTNNLVHINWGWGGAHDGYFQVSALNPGGSGTGGGGDGGYNLNQSVCYGIKEPVAGSEPNKVLGITEITVDKSSISGGQKARFNLSNVTGLSVIAFTGQVALALYDDAGNFVKMIKSSSISGLECGYYYPSLTFDVGVSDIRPNESATGIYYIRPVCRAQGEYTWKPVMVENGKVSEIPAVITNLGVSFTIIEMKFELSEAAPAVVKNAPYTIIEDRELNVELRIANTGNIDYRAQIGVKAVSLADETQVFELAHAKAILPAGATTVVSLAGVIDFPRGQYKLEAYYDPANEEEDLSFPSAKIEGETAATEFTVLPPPEPYQLSLAKAIEMPEEVEQGTPFTFKATITNSGGYFDGSLLLRFLKARNDGSGDYDHVYDPNPYQVVILTETKEVAIRYTLDLAPDSGYAAQLYYVDDATGTNTSFGDDPVNWRYFTIKERTPVTLYSIDVSANPRTGGTVTGSGGFAYGTPHTVRATARSGYIFISWTENDSVVSTEPNYSFTVEKERSLVANFAADKYAVSFTKPANGTLKLFKETTEIQSGTLVEYGTKLRVEAIPDTGYGLVSLQANGQDVIDNTVTVMETMEIVAVFSKQELTVNFTKPSNGTLKLFKDTTEIQSGTQVEYGTKLRVEAIPDTGYELVSLQANGQDVIENTVMVTGATEIVAVFAKQQFPVSFTKPANGSLKVFKETTEIQSDTLVEYGTKLRVEAIPDTGYELVSLQANGQDVIENTVTVTGAMEIVAVFAKQQFPVSFTKPANGSLKVFKGTTEIQSGTLVEYETKLRVEAIPDMGYKLVSLQANGQVITNDTVTVMGATEIKALFERWVNTDNYRIKVTNAACPGSNDGKIEISFAKQLDYTVTVKNDSGFEKTERVTATTYSLTDLAAGNYSVCFTIEGATNYKQCFEVVISQPKDLSVFKSAVADNHATYLLSGGTRYMVTHNGRSMETTDNVIQVPLRRGRNLIRITAENECQGVFEDEVYHTDSHKLILFPNPTTGQFSLILPDGEDEVTVEIISILGHSVLKEKRRVSLNGLISMNISALPNGIYLVRVNGKTVKQVTKVIKK